MTQPTQMNPEPVTAEELARVLAIALVIREQGVFESLARQIELATICPRIATELLAARAAADLIREATAKQFGMVPLITESSTTGRRDVVWIMAST